LVSPPGKTGVYLTELRFRRQRNNPKWSSDPILSCDQAAALAAQRFLGGQPSYGRVAAPDGDPGPAPLASQRQDPPDLQAPACDRVILEAW